LAKVTNTRGRIPAGINKIEKLAKVTYTGGGIPKRLNASLEFPSGIGDLSQFVYLVEPLWFSPSGIGDLG
jgi:hypothetical protein